MLKQFLTAGSAAVMVLFGAAAQAQTKWDMPTPFPAGNYQTENVRHFVSEIDKATKGQLKITVHDSGSLFKGNEIKRAVQGGQAEIGEIIISGYSNEDPMYGVDSIPFLATDYKASEKLWKASRPAIEARFAKQGLKVLYAVPWPPQGIFSAKPIDSLADLKGVKWRAYNPNTSRIAQLIGAQPVTIQAAELSQALATGAVTAFITSGSSGYDTKVWEQIKHYYKTNAWLPKNIVFVSQKAFDKLDKPTQDVVISAAAAAEARGWKLCEEKTKWYNEQLVKNGMNVADPSPRLRADFEKIGQTMVDEWIKQTGADGQAVIDAFKK